MDFNGCLPLKYLCDRVKSIKSIKVKGNDLSSINRRYNIVI